MYFTVLSLFPNLFDSYLSDSIIKRAIEKKLIKIDFLNIRDFSKDKHKKVDDNPYGGGAGMLMTCQPLFDAIKEAKKKNKGKVIYLSPKGKIFTQSKAEKMSKKKEFILLCGRYEGIDQRVIDTFVDEEISIGQYILTGGELPAMILVDTISRLVSGILGNEYSHEEESFSKILNRKKEYPHYTKPEIYEGLKVPEILLSGHHKKIEEWRRKKLK
jgi:tRNA (guanine37-N1)-methyltransferase